MRKALRTIHHRPPISPCRLPETRTVAEQWHAVSCPWEQAPVPAPRDLLRRCRFSFERGLGVRGCVSLQQQRDFHLSGFVLDVCTAPTPETAPRRKRLCLAIDWYLQPLQTSGLSFIVLAIPRLIHLLLSFSGSADLNPATSTVNCRFTKTRSPQHSQPAPSVL